MKDAMVLLVDSAHGIYVPQVFITTHSIGTEPHTWHGIKQEDADIIKAGPDHDDYWDAWDSVLNSASYTDESGNKYTLHQDSDCWTICPELMTNEEYSNFFGEMKPAPDDSYEYAVCGNCLIALANDNYSGMEDDEETATRDGLAALHRQYKQVIPDGSEYGFSHVCCECCDALPGDRYRVLCFDKVDAS